MSKKKSRITRIKEAIVGVPEKEIIDKGKIVVGKVEQSYGTKISTSFKSQVTIFNEDAVIKESIIQMAEQVCAGGGFFTVGNEEYSGTLPVEGINMTAKEYIDFWNERNNLDEVLLLASIQLIAFGNSFYEVTDKLTNIPIQAIGKAMARTKNTPIYKEYDLMTTYQYGNKKLPWESFIHFKCNTTGHEPFGSGIILGMIACPNDGTPSLYTMKKSMRKAMEIGFSKFSFGNELWVFPEASDNKIDELAEDVTNMSDTGNRVVSNAKGADIKLAVPQRTQTYDQWIKSVSDELFMAMGNPSLKLGLEQGFTKATSETASELYSKKIFSLRRVLKRNIEALWRKILEEAGFDGEKAGLRLFFGSEEIDYEIGDIMEAVAAGIISKLEARDLLREYSKWKIPKGEVPEIEPEIEEVEEE